MTEDFPVVAVDYTPAESQGAGIGRLVREQVRALQRKKLSYQVSLFSSYRGQDRSSLVNRRALISQRWLYRLWFRAGVSLPVDWLAGPCDVFHATDFVLPPTLTSTKSIVTVHDLSFEFASESASPRLRDFLVRVVPDSLNRSDVVIADSEATKMDIIRLYGLDSERVFVVLSGIDVEYWSSSVLHMTMRNSIDIPNDPFILAVGTVQPRKNYARVVEALARINRQGHNLHFVIAGGEGWLNEELHETIDRTNMSSKVHFLGYVDDSHLPYLYQSARAVVFVSLYEGFGFPILEAMASQTPVITSNLSSMPEVAGDATILVDPKSVDEIEAALIRVITDEDLSETLIQRGIQRARQFTWDRAASQLDAVYRHVLQL